MSKSYQGEEVTVYKQTPGKVYCLNPAFERHLLSGDGRKLLDIGCGDGFYYNMCRQRGYEYSGMDISGDMIKKAIANFPEGDFKVGSCSELSTLYEQNSFDVVISSMLFPEFETLDYFKKVLREILHVLKEGGVFLLGTAHPAFDMYMRKFLLNSDIVEADFGSYFDSGKLFKVKGKSLDVVFYDHHWTLENYVNELINAGFEITFIDECPVIDKARDEDPFYDERIRLPSFILFEARKRKANSMKIDNS